MEIIDINLQKIIQKQGVGQIAHKYQEIFFFVEFYDKQNLLLCDFPNYPQKAILGQGQLFEPLENALKNMLIGERSTFYIQHQTIDKMEVEILRTGQIQDNLWDLNDIQKSQISLNLKDQGNYSIKQNDYQDAELKYKFAENLIRDDNGNLFDSLKQTLKSNLALAFLKNNKNEECIKICQTIKHQNVKLLYRCAQALINQSKFEEAQREIQEIFHIEPENKEAQQLLKEIEKKQKIQTQKEKQVFQKMFK